MTTIRTKASVLALDNEGYAGDSFFDSTFDTTSTTARAERATNVLLPVTNKTWRITFPGWDVKGIAWRATGGLTLTVSNVGATKTVVYGVETGAAVGDLAYTKMGVLVFEDPLLVSDFSAGSISLTHNEASDVTATIVVWG